MRPIDEIRRIEFQIESLEAKNKDLVELVLRLAEAVSLIRPLAEGYVAKNDVGSNKKYLSIANDTLDDPLLKKLRSETR